MVVITDDKGNKTNAIDLILTKDMAYAILSGKKKIEFRKYSKFYHDRLLDKECAKAVNAGKTNVQYKPIDSHFVHFHDYNKSWSLNVAIKSIDLMPMNQSSIPYLRQHGCFEMDDLIAEQEIKGIKADSKEALWAYCMPIFFVVNTTLDVSKINVIQRGDIPEKYQI